MGKQLTNNTAERENSHFVPVWHGCQAATKAQFQGKQRKLKGYCVRDRKTDKIVASDFILHAYSQIFQHEFCG